MTIAEAISRINTLKPNNFEIAAEKAWLSILDGMIKTQIIDKHEGSERIEFCGYNEDTPEETELLVPAPYDDIYVKWLEMQMDYTNGDFDRYENSMEAYNTLYRQYAVWYTQTHMPKSVGRKFIF